MSSTATWFNFLASHDGIGLRATEGILDDAERAALVERTRAHGGRVSMASRPDGTSTVYELNLGYLDALCTPEEAADPATLAAKALAAHSILFAFLGVPAIYYHSLVGSPPDHEGMEASRINRRINREVLDADRLVAELARRPAPARRSSPACGTCSTYDGSTRRSHRSAPSTSSVSTTASSQSAAAAGTPDELLCVTNVTGAHGHVAGGDRPRRARRPGRRTADAGAVGLRLGAAAPPEVSARTSYESWSSMARFV